MALDDPDTLEIQVGTGPGARAFALRRPTAGECDVIMLARLVSVFVSTQSKIRDAEADPTEGVALRVANLTEVAGDALKQVRARVRKTLAACGAPEVVVWFDGLEAVEGWQAVLEITRFLCTALAVKPAARLGK